MTVVTAPPATPPTVGLVVSARTNLDNEAGGDWERGLTYAPETCGGYRGLADCSDADTDHSEPPGDTVDHRPWLLQVDEECTTIGLDVAALDARLGRRLAAIESYAIARELWTGELTAADATVANTGLTDADPEYRRPNGYLARPEAVVLASAAVSVNAGMGMLEQAVGDALHGQQAMIHVPRIAAPFVEPRLRVAGNLRMTVTDQSAVIDAGYPNTGPDGTKAPNGSAWLYATGPVVVRRGAVYSDTDDMAQTIDTRNNRITRRVQRLVAAHFDPCALFAVRIITEGTTS